MKTLREFSLELPKGSILFGDKAYTDYLFEEVLLEAQEIRLLAKRKSNSKRQHSDSENLLLKKYRNRIETVFSCITSRLPRFIKVRTEKGFCLKVIFAILAYMINLYHPLY